MRHHQMRMESNMDWLAGYVQHAALGHRTPYDVPYQPTTPTTAMTLDCTTNATVTQIIRNKQSENSVMELIIWKRE